MKRNLWKIGLGALVLLVTVAGATAIAARHIGGRHDFMRRHIAAMIDDALDAAKATPAQRATITAAREQAMATIQEAHKGHRGDMEEAVALFKADKIDAAKLADLRARHEAVAKQTGDAIVRAITTAHDALQPAQRKAVADYLRAHKPGAHMARMRGEMMKRMATAKLDEALDAVSATAQQRAQIGAARDQLIASLEELKPADGMGAHLEKALALFEADRIDPRAVAALRAEHEAKIKQAGDAVVQAIYDLHDALSAEQRQALVTWAKAQRGRHGHGGHGPALDAEDAHE